MPDFAITPELPAGYPIDGRRSVARLVSVQTVVVSQTPVVTSPVTETGLHAIVPLIDLPVARPSDQLAQDLVAPSVPGATTETGMSSYASATEVARSGPDDQLAQDLVAPSVPVAVTERTSASVRIA
ncbi:MAG: hypothetical protein ACO2PN_11215 [Pyrobaculum sp.]|jgi:hypothetical protein